MDKFLGLVLLLIRGRSKVRVASDSPSISKYNNSKNNDNNNNNDKNIYNNNNNNNEINDDAFMVDKPRANSLTISISSVKPESLSGSSSNLNINNIPDGIDADDDLSSSNANMIVKDE